MCILYFICLSCLITDSPKMALKFPLQKVISIYFIMMVILVGFYYNVAHFVHKTAKSLVLKPLHFPDYNHLKTALKLPQGRSKINMW